MGQDQKETVETAGNSQPSEKKHRKLNLFTRLALSLLLLQILLLILAVTLTYLNDNLLTGEITQPYTPVGRVAVWATVIGLFLSLLATATAAIAILASFSKNYLWRNFITCLAVFLVSGSLYAISLPLNHVIASPPRYRCSEYSKKIAIHLQKYAANHFGRMPLNRWHIDLVEDCYIPPHFFLNENILGRKITDLPADVIVMFESKHLYPDWADIQVGTAKDLSPDHHDGKGAIILFADMHTKFVKTRDFPALRWKP